MSAQKRSLSAEQLAKLFAQLSRLETSGISAVQAFSIIAKSEAQLKKPLTLLLQQLTRGRPVSEAGFKAGIFDEHLKTIIQAAEISGRLTSIYGLLADYYSDLSKRLKKVKSRLTLPASLLTLSLFVQPLPALVSSEINGLVYLQLSLGRLFIIALIFYLLFRLPAILKGFGLESAWHRLQLSTPVIADWVAKRQINHFFYLLAILLESGVAFDAALPGAAAAINNRNLKDTFKPALTMRASGAGVAETLAKIPAINPVMLGIVKSSEQSGNLAGGILHFTRLEAETISLQDDALADWLPRFVYCLIAAWMAYSILGSPMALPPMAG